jgi:anti-sigma-K factor RskA
MTDRTMRPPMPELSCDEVRDLAASFVLDALEPDESDAVRAHLATCPEAHEEMTELASVLPVLAETAPVVEPPAGLGSRIRAAAEAELAAGRGPVSSAAPAVAAVVATTAPATPAAIPFPTGAEREAPTGRRRGSALAAVLGMAAVFAIVALGAWNIQLQGQLSQAEAYQQAVAEVMEVAGQPGALSAVLTTESGTGATGIAAISPDGTMTLAMQALQPTSGTQVYETWMISGDEAPVALGGFQVGSDGLGAFQGTGLPPQEGLVLALTLEPRAGLTAPTGPVVSSGAATSAG